MCLAASFLAASSLPGDRVLAGTAIGKLLFATIPVEEWWLLPADRPTLSLFAHFPRQCSF